MGIRTITWGIFFILILTAYILSPEIFVDVTRVLRSGDVDQIAEYIRSFGGLAVLVSIFLSTLMTFGLIIPFVLISAANGLVFGVGWGTVVSWAGEVIGAMIAFGIYRYYFRPSLMRRYKHTQYWRYVDKINRQHGFKTVLIARVLPVIPSGILTATAAISTISFGDFCWATVLGKIPSVFVKVLVGHDLVYFERYKIRFILGLLCLGLLYAGAWWVKGRGR